MKNVYEKAVKAAEHLMETMGTKPELGIILGSGLGPLAEAVENPGEIPYSDIPYFPRSTVEGHEGKLVWGTLSGRPVLLMKGRFHYYEGYDAGRLVFHIRVFKLLGIDNLLVTNAAGGVNRSFRPGDIMLINDHIGFFAPSPLRGENIKEFGVRFPDMSEAYSRELLDIAEKAAAAEGLEIKEGVYAFARGPMYETPAEIRAFRALGADAVGMSTVPEVIAASHAGMRVMGISCITNMAAGVLDRPLRHGEVMETAKASEKKLVALVKKVVELWGI